MLSAYAAYLALHFLAYVFVLRDSGRLRTERAIFFYHLVPAAISAVAGLVYLLTEPSPARLARLLLALSVHGIYSTSFLEVWSLAQGGYSLSVLRNIAESDANRGDLDLAQLKQIGEAKQHGRIQGLAALGLVSERNGTITLTTLGGLIASCLHGLLQWIDPAKRAGTTA
jgi:hypothetical protein